MKDNTIKKAVSSNNTLFYIVLCKQQRQSRVWRNSLSEDTKQLILFKEISGKSVEVDFDGDEVR